MPLIWNANLMKKEELMKMLRNPAQYHKEKEKKKTVEQESSVQQQKNLSPEQKKENALLLGVGVGVVILVFATLLISLSAKNRAENLTAALDPKQLEGLTVADKEFNPSAGVTYVHIQEGQDRNVSVSNLGSTLPIISRFNYKTFTPKNFEIIGAAPWALTTNFSSNIADPELMRYLLGNDKMIQSFINRPDVAPLLEDPQLLLAFTEDKASMKEFFESEPVQGVLKNEKMLRTVAGSRFMSYLLISKAVKHFRDRPQEALQIIKANPYLEALRQNPNVQVAVAENPYLKKIASVLLEGTSSSTTKPTGKVTPAKTNAK